ncbi:MAG TPA: DUF2147 domain-containing protein [Croceibacterium sp.]|nr:DUF2147 domain-containing protein [Croceibacterium sp.]
MTGRLGLVLAGVALGATPAAAAGPSIAGNWVTADRTAVVRVAECGRKLCGTVVEVLARGVPRSDVHNPRRALRARPLVGLQVLRGFAARGGEWRGGTAYDPKTGNSYRATLALAPDGRLKVTGCVLLICRSQMWTRD